MPFMKEQERKRLGKQGSVAGGLGVPASCLVVATPKMNLLPPISFKEPDEGQY